MGGFRFDVLAEYWPLFVEGAQITIELTIGCVCCGVVLIFMSTVMFVCILICAVITEALTVLIFRGYKKDGASVFAGIIFFPLTLPFLYIYYNFLYTVTDETGIAVSAFIGANPGIAIGMSVAVVAVCALGTVVGLLIARGMRRSGAMKK